MTIWAALAGGFAGTLVLTTALEGAMELGLTRMNIPFLLGTALSRDRTRAKLLGYVLHFLAGLLFAVGYWALFLAIGRASWWLGALFGLTHAAFAGTALVNILLPAVHPRMGTPVSAADSAPLLEPPGFMMLNYGRSTPVVSVLAHLAYGAIVGGFIQMAWPAAEKGPSASLAQSLLTWQASCDIRLSRCDRLGPRLAATPLSSKGHVVYIWTFLSGLPGCTHPPRSSPPPSAAKPVRREALGSRPEQGPEHDQRDEDGDDGNFSEGGSGPQPEGDG
jgi:hypothetical protein